MEFFPPIMRALFCLKKLFQTLNYITSLIYSEKADCTITMSDDDLLGMMTGTLNAQKV